MKNIEVGNIVTTADGKQYEVYDVIDSIVYAYSLKYREDCTIHISQILYVR